MCLENVPWTSEEETLEVLANATMNLESLDHLYTVIYLRSDFSVFPPLSSLSSSPLFVDDTCSADFQQ